MKKSLSTLLDKIEQRDNLFKMFHKNPQTLVEVLSDETAELVRGGDREYVPMYESDEVFSLWQRPTILLNL